jgi:PEP-CTERM putative exosortase interaction domain
MNKLTRLLALAAVSATAAVCSRAGTYADITIDGDFSDWDGIPAAYTDANESLSKDINQIFLANNDTHLFIRITFNATVNPQSGNGFYLGFDNDSNASTGFNVYGLGLVGTEAAYQNDFPFEQALGEFNTGAANSGAGILISPYNSDTQSQEFSISRAAVIDTGTGQLIFPNNSFVFAAYFNDSGDDFAGPVSYTFATAAIPEPSALAALAGLGVLGLAAVRRRR